MVPIDRHHQIIGWEIFFKNELIKWSVEVERINKIFSFTNNQLIFYRRFKFVPLSFKNKFW